MLTFSMRRAAVLMAVGGVALTALAGRVAYLQTYAREETVRKVERQQHRQEVLPARRGSIYDRNGLLMAGTVQSNVLFVDPRFLVKQFTEAAEEEIKRQKEIAQLRADGKPVRMPSEKQLAERATMFPWRYEPWNGIEPAMERAMTEVAGLVDRTPQELMAQIFKDPEARFVRLAEKVDSDAAGKVARLRIPGLGFQPMPVRCYPMDDLAAHVLGGMSSDGVGLDGLEGRYETTLRGRDGFMREMKDNRGQPIAVSADDFTEPRHGQHLALTIDANIQMIAEQELRTSIAQFGAESGEAVVMDVRTGEVLALANYPTYRPDELSKAGVEQRKNRALVAPYEPGSTIKPFIVGPALQEKITRASESFHLGGKVYRTSYGRSIEDVHGYDDLVTWDVLVKSSNIGMAKIGERMGNGRLHSALTRFGFGRTTGVELPGEAPGRVRGLGGWTHYSTHSVVMGYEITVTPLQLAVAMSAISNGGRLVRPTVMRGVVDTAGDINSLPRQVSAGDTGAMIAIDAGTAGELRRILADVLVRGTGAKARSDTYNIFGKTGTAHLTEPGKRGYLKDAYTSSFVGGAPFENPRLAVVFVIHRAEKRAKDYFGGTAAAPGAAAILERSLQYLGEPASPPLPKPPPEIAGKLHRYNETEHLYEDWPESARKIREEARANANIRWDRVSLPGYRGTTRPIVPMAPQAPPPSQPPAPDSEAMPAGDRR
jgi:cell division protein FtsI (penicillin-binding protein 3)